MQFLDQLRGTASQQRRLELIREALELNGSEISQVLLLFPDDSPRFDAIQLYLRPFDRLRLSWSTLSAVVGLGLFAYSLGDRTNLSQM